MENDGMQKMQYSFFMSSDAQLIVGDLNVNIPVMSVSMEASAMQTQESVYVLLVSTGQHVNTSWAATGLGRMAAFLVIPQEMITVQGVGVNSSAYQTPLDAPVQQDSWESIVQQNVSQERMEPIVCNCATVLQVTPVPRVQENALMGLHVKKDGLVSTVKTVPYYAIASFYYTKVNNGEPTTLVCVVTGSPPPTSENIIVTDAAGADEGIILLGTNVTESTRTSWYRVMVNLDEVIPEESWECSALSELEINVSTDGQNGFPRTLSFDTMAGTANIEQLEDCSTYNINAAFRNKDELGISSEILSVSTSLIRPASVEALHMSPSTTEIEVSWETSSSPCSPDYYIIRYSLYQKLACSSLETTPTEFEVNSSVTQYNNLVGLEPYSRYQITVTAVNGAGQSEPAIGYSDTRPGPTSNITNVRVNPERTSPTRLGFTWQPLNCGNVNGVFWYYYPRIYKDGDRHELPAKKTYLDDDISYSSVEFNGLEACTMYELNLHARNRDVPTPGNVSNAIGVTGVTFTSAYAYATGNQLRVQWSVPSQCNVDYYRLSYHLISRKACQDVPVIDAPVYELNVTSNTTYVSEYLSDLEYYATYSISIIAVIRRAESLPKNVSGDTRDGDPSAIETVSYTSTASSLRFVWEEPSCESLHGALYGYEYDLYDPTGGGRYVRPSMTIRRNYVLIPGLDACTEYRFRIRIVTTQLKRSESHMAMAMTNISAPGMPVITELTPHQEDIGTTGLTVSWQPPSSPPCQPTHYEIKYYVRQGDMCEDIPSDPRMNLTGTVNGSTFTFNVLELRPYSEYMVFVRGRTSSGYGDSDSEVATTGYSHPTGPPTNIQSTSIKKRSIVFTWEKPECSDRNGPISSYEVMLSNSTGDVVYHGNASASAGPELFEIFDLIPYSIYRIRIRAWNYELAGEYGPAIWAQTDESKPAPPIGVNLPSSDQESITVEWMSPNPPLGRIIGYYILYWEADDVGATPQTFGIECRDGLCSDINYRFSTIIPHLQRDTNYSVQASVILAGVLLMDSVY
ncbi:tyrosine-protein phosphatase Lar-like [Strongylocentrotus purpuratus]|uniref:Fibronectin type-III domain-containing protein n=1 Tax=Strongylocentrotus purpuratus TaxID=7668 RepID=A0A7M7PKP6_STRPU|nr:tyrosine-protein phosphatase Lar-like [Strongylocentrotus purpuratus]